MKSEYNSKSKFQQTEIGKVPEDWKVDRIEPYLDKIIDYRGKTPKKSTFGIKTLSAKSIKNGRIDYSKTYFISEETFKKWERRGKPKVGDVLLTTEGPLGEVAQLDRENVAISQRLLVLRGKNGLLDNTYLKYYLMSSIGQHELLSRSTGTTVQGIKQSEFRQILIILPPFSEQKAIARILSSLDDKIKLNQRMNKTLEAIAQAIFKRWFIDFEFPNEEGKPYKSSGGEMVYNEELGKEIPKGWKVGMIKDEFNLVMGQSPPGKTYNEHGEGVPFFQGRTDFGFRYPNKRMYCTEPKRFAQKDDTLVSVRAPVGDLNMAFENCCIGRGLAAIRHKTGSRSYTYYLMSYIKKQIQSFESEGTVFGSITKDKFQSIRIIVPPRELIMQFEKTLFPLDEQIRNNEKQSLELSQIRDALLPKLMSGEIRIPVNEMEET